MIDYCRPDTRNLTLEVIRSMKSIRLILPIATLIAAFFATSGISFATKEMGTKEKKPCTTCHTKGKELNDVGKHYKEKKTLEGAPAPKK